MTRVSKAVIPAAGRGTRFLPATKVVPKELLPIVDRPMISYAVGEAVAAGAGELIVVTAPDKQAIEDHFRPDPALEDVLERGGKADLLERLRAETAVPVRFALQERPLGLGHAVGCARGAVGREPFAVLLPDELIVDDLLARMLAVFEAEAPLAVIGLMDVPREEISSYGSVDPETTSREGVVRVRSIVEKPPVDEAPSTLATIGRYVFTADVFDALDRIEPGVGGELQLTDAIELLASKGDVLGVVLERGRYDVGRKIDFLRANVEMALLRDDLRDELWAFLRELEGRGTA